MSDRAVIADARQQVTAQWNANPCGALDGSPQDPGYFDRVEQDRYRQQYWQRDFFDYQGYAGKSVLEVGIGLGTDIRQFALAGAEVAGVDITDKHLELTAQNFASMGKSIDLRKADAAAIPFPDASFDGVHSFGVLHHIPDVENVLAEIYRVLKPGGTLQCAVYHNRSLSAFALVVRSILNGELFDSEMGWEGTKAQIESGADGKGIRPYVKLYSKGEWRRTVENAGFVTEKMAIRQIQFERKVWLNALRPLEGLFGWYVAGVFRKPL
jgi:ubiquinone/menaquinone biosynthesis C-methylase UbiE